ncbi:hypothetical protein O181_023213 [Austropuccinia psidii MF-1]|uniref:ATP-dependent DNA helicase PIF1 n=1 Tax=Austropuccinia psidii MF-1 TaxID=1389203 RepID=A0A9Q3CGN2_9BASI|nr:hypothetical protein [Austropuccinia psidii MF-1]
MNRLGLRSRQFLFHPKKLLEIHSRMSFSLKSASSHLDSHLQAHQDHDDRPKSSGKLSSLQRQWSSTSKQNQIQPKIFQESQNAAHSSSQPSWQASESDWPLSPPQIKKNKSTSSIPFKPQTSNINLVKSPSNQINHKNLASKGKANMIPTTKFEITSMVNAVKKSKTPSLGKLNEKLKVDKPIQSLKREFPWDVPANSTKIVKKSTTLYTLPSVENATKPPKSNHLGNPNISIAAKVSLSPEQQNVLDLVLRGESVFFTGSAGTGKSVLLRHIISALKRNHSARPDAVAVTASTGMAACCIGGTTIHSFGGIGLGVEPPDHLVNKVKKNSRAAARWIRTKVLVIDEISMVDGGLFDKLAYIAQKIRKSTKPFGGIQVVIAGDFFQLPPVSNKSQVLFAFNAKKWSECISQTISLTQVFRQKDTTFIDMLSEMRMGQLSAKSIERFRQLSREITYEDGIAPTELFPTRQEVERSNSSRLNALPGEEVVYVAHDTGKASPEQRTRDLANMLAIPRLVLKKGAQVMMIKNQLAEEGPAWLVNGLVGKVVDFVDPNADVDQYASDLRDQSSSNGLNDQNHKPTAYPPPRGAVSTTNDSTKDDTQSRVQSGMPLVEWYLPTGKRELTIVGKAEFKVENAEGVIQSRRVQLPLILAWAMSIHKSQGQTLNRVKVDLGRVFEKGQIYVALSRATSLEGLQVLRFDSKKVMAHPDVIKWSKLNLNK